MTRRDTESYEDFIRASPRQPLARQVKLADLEDNMDLKQLPHGGSRTGPVDTLSRAWLVLQAVQETTR
ncbi:MAG: hypothetical protein R2932_25255 [Caldilineaceae bacterium]